MTALTQCEEMGVGHQVRSEEQRQRGRYSPIRTSEHYGPDRKWLRFVIVAGVLLAGALGLYYSGLWHQVKQSPLWNQLVPSPSPQPLPALPEHKWHRLIEVTNAVLDNLPQPHAMGHGIGPVSGSTCTDADKALKEYRDLVESWSADVTSEAQVRVELEKLVAASELGLQALENLCDEGEEARPSRVLQSIWNPQLTKSRSTILAGPTNFAHVTPVTQLETMRPWHPSADATVRRLEKSDLEVKVKVFQKATLIAVKGKSVSDTERKTEEASLDIVRSGMAAHSAFKDFKLAKTAATLAKASYYAVRTPLKAVAEEGLFGAGAVEGVTAVVCAAAEPCGGIVATAAAVGAVGSMLYDLWTLKSSVQHLFSTPTLKPPYKEDTVNEDLFDADLQLEETNFQNIEAELKIAVSASDAVLNDIGENGVKEAADSAHLIRHSVKRTLKYMDTMINAAANLKRNDDKNIKIYEDSCGVFSCSYEKPRRVVPENIVSLTNKLRMVMQSWDSQLSYFTDCVSSVEGETCSKWTIDANMHKTKQDFRKVINMLSLLEKHVCQYGRPGSTVPWTVCK